MSVDSTVSTDYKEQLFIIFDIFDSRRWLGKLLVREKVGARGEQVSNRETETKVDSKSPIAPAQNMGAFSSKTENTPTPLSDQSTSGGVEDLQDGLWQHQADIAKDTGPVDQESALEDAGLVSSNSMTMTNVANKRGDKRKAATYPETHSEEDGLIRNVPVADGEILIKSQVDLRSVDHLQRGDSTQSPTPSSRTSPTHDHMVLWTGGLFHQSILDKSPEEIASIETTIKEDSAALMEQFEINAASASQGNLGPELAAAAGLESTTLANRRPTSMEGDPNSAAQASDKQRLASCKSLATIKPWKPPAYMVPLEIEDDHEQSPSLNKGLWQRLYQNSLYHWTKDQVQCALAILIATFMECHIQVAFLGLVDLGQALRAIGAVHHSVPAALHETFARAFLHRFSAMYVSIESPQTKLQHMEVLAKYTGKIEDESTHTKKKVQEHRVAWFKCLSRDQLKPLMYRNILVEKKDGSGVKRSPSPLIARITQGLVYDVSEGTGDIYLEYEQESDQHIKAPIIICSDKTKVIKTDFFDVDTRMLVGSATFNLFNDAQISSYCLALEMNCRSKPHQKRGLSLQATTPPESTLTATGEHAVYTDPTTNTTYAYLPEISPQARDFCEKVVTEAAINLSLYHGSAMFPPQLASQFEHHRKQARREAADLAGTFFGAKDFQTGLHLDSDDASVLSAGAIFSMDEEWNATCGGEFFYWSHFVLLQLRRNMSWAWVSAKLAHCTALMDMHNDLHNSDLVSAGTLAALNVHSPEPAKTRGTIPSYVKIFNHFLDIPEGPSERGINATALNQIHAQDEQTPPSTPNTDQSETLTLPPPLTLASKQILQALKKSLLRFLQTPATHFKPLLLDVEYKSLQELDLPSAVDLLGCTAFLYKSEDEDDCDQKHCLILKLRTGPPVETAILTLPGLSGRNLVRTGKVYESKGRLADRLTDKGHKARRDIAQKGSGENRTYHFDCPYTYNLFADPEKNPVLRAIDVACAGGETYPQNTYIFIPTLIHNSRSLAEESVRSRRLNPAQKRMAIENAHQTPLQVSILSQGDARRIGQLRYRLKRGVKEDKLQKLDSAIERLREEGKILFDSVETGVGSFKYTVVFTDPSLLRAIGADTKRIALDAKHKVSTYGDFLISAVVKTDHGLIPTLFCLTSDLSVGTGAILSAARDHVGERTPELDREGWSPVIVVDPLQLDAVVESDLRPQIDTFHYFSGWLQFLRSVVRNEETPKVLLLFLTVISSSKDRLDLAKQLRLRLANTEGISVEPFIDRLISDLNSQHTPTRTDSLHSGSAESIHGIVTQLLPKKLHMMEPDEVLSSFDPILKAHMMVLLSEYNQTPLGKRRPPSTLVFTNKMSLEKLRYDDSFKLARYVRQELSCSDTELEQAFSHFQDIWALVPGGPYQTARSPDAQLTTVPTTQVTFDRVTKRCTCLGYFWNWSSLCKHAQTAAILEDIAEGRTSAMKIKEKVVTYFRHRERKQEPAILRNPKIVSSDNGTVWDEVSRLYARYGDAVFYSWGLQETVDRENGVVLHAFETSLPRKGGATVKGRPKNRVPGLAGFPESVR
ncbi:hypothetical protein HDU93_002259 [Gonapodya sp. JEL0774]|nr:hypothetical protein HDU93_002259 [Gonapodya sp. JEL0774]